MMGDAPIIDINFLSFGNVVKIGDLRVQRGKTRRAKSSCRHFNLMFDNAERRIWCQDCESDVDAFDAVETIAMNLHRANDLIAARNKELKEAENFNLISIAAKNIDKEWRKTKSVPSCPHCNEPLLAQYFKRKANIPVQSKSLAEHKYKTTVPTPPPKG